MTTDALNSLIDELENENGKPEPSCSSPNVHSNERDLEAYLRDSGRLLRTIPKSDGVVHEITCINDENHEAAVGEKVDGMLWSKCHHNSCQGKHTWQHVKAALGKPPWESKKKSKKKSKKQQPHGAEDFNDGDDNKEKAEDFNDGGDEEEKGKAEDVDPADHVELFIELNSDAETNLPLLRRWRGVFYRRAGGKYVEIDEEDAKSAIVLHLKSDYAEVVTKVVSNVMMQLRAEVLLSSTRESHNWIADHAGNKFDPSELICTRNRILHLPSIINDPNYEPIVETPAFFNLNATEFDFVPRCDARTPERWLQFIDEVMPSPEETKTLQQWFGYALTQKTNQQKILTLIGPKRSGKGTIARVLGNLVGKPNVAGPTLSSFSQNFGLQSLIGKQLGIIADARIGGKGMAEIVERLLSISGEDCLTIDRKYLSPWIGILKSRLMILSNELPRLADASGALASRMIVLTMKDSFFGREDLKLGEQLESELPGIFWWAVDGYASLLAEGRLHVPKSSEKQLMELGRLASNEKAFLEDHYRITPDHENDWIAKEDLYQHFKMWCVGEGIERVPTLSVFAKNLISASGQKIGTGKRTDSSGRRFPVFKGLRRDDDKE